MMIINSAGNNVPPIARGNPVYYDEFGNRYKDLVKRISINPSSTAGRIEKISLIYINDNNRPSLYKECGVGNIGEKKSVIELKNYAYSISNSSDGKYIQSGGFLDYLIDGQERNPSLYYGYMNQLSPYRININDDSYKTTIVPSIASSDFTPALIDNEVCGFENSYQLPYTDTLGLLNSFFLTWTYSYPFECYVYINTKKGVFNVPRITYLPHIDKDGIASIYADFIREVSNLCEYLSYIIKKERNYVNFMIFLHPFGSTVNIIDDNKRLRQLYHNHNSAQAQSIMKNVRADGLKYIGSDSLGLLEESVLCKPVDQALECCDVLY
jgi:hypothetical protein